MGFGHQNDLAAAFHEEALATLQQMGNQSAELFTLHALMFGQQGHLSVLKFKLAVTMKNYVFQYSLAQPRN